MKKLIIAISTIIILSVVYILTDSYSGQTNNNIELITDQNVTLSDAKKDIQNVKVVLLTSQSTNNRSTEDVINSQISDDANVETLDGSTVPVKPEFKSTLEVNGFLVSDKYNKKGIDGRNFETASKDELVGMMDVMDSDLTSKAANYRSDFEFLLMNHEHEADYTLERVSCTDFVCIANINANDEGKLKDITKIILSTTSKGAYPRITSSDDFSINLSVIFSTNADVSSLYMRN